MVTETDNSPPKDVIKQYGISVDGLHWEAIASGHSGSTVWRGVDGNNKPILALKRWPKGFGLERLQYIHSHVPKHNLVPLSIKTVYGATAVQYQEYVYDVTNWLPGTPALAPNNTQIKNAIITLAELHTYWANKSSTVMPIPAVHRRLELLGSQPEEVTISTNYPDSLLQTLQYAQGDSLRFWGDVAEALGAWHTYGAPCHLCLCDIHEEHVLFEGDTVTGVIDFGAMKTDHPALDLSRLLGDYSDTANDIWGWGLEVYRQQRPEVDIPSGLVKALALSTAVGGLKHWLLRASTGERFARPEVVEQRINRLRRRAARFIE